MLRGQLRLKDIGYNRFSRGKNRWAVLEQVGGIQFTITARCFQDFGAFLCGKILPLFGGVDVIANHLHNFIVRYGTGVGEIQDARDAFAGQFQRMGQ